MIRPLDYASLTRPVTRPEVSAFREAMRTRPGYSGTSAVVVIIVALVALLIFGSVFATVLVGVVSAVASSVENPGARAVGIIVPLVFVAGFVAIAALVIRSVVRGGKWERWLRLDGFAAANGLVFSPIDADPQYPGSIFQLGRARAAVEHLRSASGRFLDYGNYRYTTGSGKSQSTHTWGFLALQLDRALPNMVLDSKGNNGIFGSNLPVTFSKDQVLHLEGDFDTYFTLYCPKEYERDALYVFTPDLMALLIDNAAPFDVEIVDQWMFVYSSAAFDVREPALHERLLGIVDTVGAKTLTQTDRYSDERVGDVAANVVAPQGQRLKRGVSVGAIIVVLVIAGVWLWPFFGGILGSLIQ